MSQEKKIREAGEKGKKRGGSDPNAQPFYLQAQHQQIFLILFTVAAQQNVNRFLLNFEFLCTDTFDEPL